MPIAQTFRTRCPYVTRDVLHWFPGHMNKGIKQMQQKLKTVDCLIEVHDSRIPFTGRNPMFTRSLAGIKPHILVLNKKDLTEAPYNPHVRQQLRTEEGVQHVIYTNCKDQDCHGIKKITPLVVNLVKNSDRFNRSEEKEYNVMIIGVPNVGKSSLINRLRSHNLRGRHSLPVGGVAGVTKSVLMKMRISRNPSIFMLDTPGILEPSVSDIETGLTLALCASLQDHLVGEEIIADYLLYWLNKHNNFSYVEFMGCPGPSDNITEVLIAGAVKHKKLKLHRQFDNKIRELPDLMESARIMIKAFRTGGLGKIFLDFDKLKTKPEAEPEAESETAPGA